ncbi:hypothetical protein N0V90_008055 [Kalmusia sp. IMI 367209]|nr:hypothetical protein N0V90_008055 [Kalmusia sp. IMI 367209]
MSEDYFQDQSNATAHSGDIVLDPAIISSDAVGVTQHQNASLTHFHKHFLPMRRSLLLKAMEQSNQTPTNWFLKWEKFYALGTVRMLALKESARDPNLELKQLSRELLAKVIPRLLRPLKPQGRKANLDD